MTAVMKHEVLDYLVRVADDAGRAILSIYSEPIVHIDEKADCSPLTSADLAANEVIVAALRQAFPEIPLLTEEGTNQFRPGEEPARYWAVDPLDGTKEFIRRNGEFTVNIALIEFGTPIMGVVGAPALGLMFFGAVGHGAFRRDQKDWIQIRANSAVPSADRLIRVAQSRSHSSGETSSFLKKLGPVDSRDVGSSLKFCLVAAGEVDFYPRFGPTCIWDTAAGHAIVQAAGGSVTTEDGRPLLYPCPGTPLNPNFIAWGCEDLRNWALRTDANG